MVKKILLITIIACLIVMVLAIINFITFNEMKTVYLFILFAFITVLLFKARKDI